MYNEIVNSNIPAIPVNVALHSKINFVGRVSTPHIHNEIELLYVREGMYVLKSDKTTIEVCAGDVIFVNSRVVHETSVGVAGTQCVLFQFDASKIMPSSTEGVSKYLRNFLNIGEYPLYHFRAGEASTLELLRYLEKIIEEKEKAEKAYETYIYAECCNILAFLRRRNMLADVNDFLGICNDERIFPAFEFIEKNYRNKVTLEELSKVTGLNPYYFCRLFKKITNSTFVEYLNFVRIYKAEKLITEGEKTISEIAEEVGFTSASYFNRVFRRVKGCAPSSYKKVKYAVQ